MENKVAIVSGANGNLGRAVVQYFLAQKWLVIGMEHRLCSSIIEENYQEIEVNLLDENATYNCVNKIITDYGRIDALVHTVGGFAMGNIADTSTQDIFKQYQLNFETTYNLVRPILDKMQNQKNGDLFFIGSLAGKDTSKGKGVTAYSLSKSLLFQLAKLIEAESIGTAIQTHVVVPSIIDTPQNRAAMPNADFSKWEKPESIAKVIGQYFGKEKQVIIIQDEM